MRSDNAKVLLQMHEAGYLKRFMRRFDENREDNKKRRPGSLCQICMSPFLPCRKSLAGADARFTRMKRSRCRVRAGEIRFT